MAGIGSPQLSFIIRESNGSIHPRYAAEINRSISIAHSQRTMVILSQTTNPKIVGKLHNCLKNIDGVKNDH